MSASLVSVLVEDAAWKKSGVPVSRVKAAAELALEHESFLPSAERGGGAPKGRKGRPLRRASEGEETTILLTNDARLHELNARFRGKDAPTNVLSFPAADGAYLGDVAIALGVMSREAAAAGISLPAHTLHLVVHGVLHLLGYDHVRSREAHVMERLEVAILDELGIPNPYTRADATR